MSTTLEDQSQQIRARMARLRQHMHVNAQQVFENTNKLFDWKDYVRQYPKGLLAVGLLAGFVLAPGRKVTSSVRLSKESMDELLAARESISHAQAGIPPTLMSGVLRLLTGVALSGGSILVRKGIDAYFNRHRVETPDSANMNFRRG